jgi:hypothetical protein
MGSSSSATVVMDLPFTEAIFIWGGLGPEAHHSLKSILVWLDTLLGSVKDKGMV